MKNQEFSLDKLFTDTELTNLHTLSDTKNQKINKNLYYNPLGYPYAYSYNFLQGSVFEDYVIPTGSYEFDGEWKQIKTDLTLNDYESWVFDEIKKNILDVYKKGLFVNLLFSGGIDSLVVASFVLANGLIDKTKFITIYDKIQHDDFALVNDKDTCLKIENFMKCFKVGDWDQVELTMSDFVDVCNTKCFENLRCHSTASLFSKMKDEIFIGGHGGNWSLLHYQAQLDELLIKNPNLFLELPKITQNKNIYCLSNKNYKFRGVPFSDHHFVKKRWHLLSGINGNLLPLVISNDDIYNQTRRINWDTIDLLTISDASIARRIIKKNVGNAFDKFIYHENVEDCDSFVSINLDYDSLDKTIFDVPDNLNHNEQGLLWWENELKSSKDTGVISSNTVASFLVMHQLSQDINTKCAIS